MSLFNELKRRNVFRVAIAYVIVAWLVMQIADVVLNNITPPDWVFQVLMLFLAVGLPIAVIFAWAFEMTPEGLKREHEVDRSQSITRHTGRKLDYLIIGVMALALGYFVVDKFALEPSQQATETGNAETADKSIAVLAFVNMSDDPGNEYFSDGIAEELLNVLARIEGLRVVSRTSSFAFKGGNKNLAEIADALKVSYVLEGSVRKAGNRVRITAQLIEAASDRHLWSEIYDRDLTDIFAIQNEIANAIGDSLEVELLGEDALASGGGTRDLQAYEHYLQGRHFWRRRNADDLLHAEQLLERAVEIDPNYADAWTALGATYIVIPSYVTIEPEPYYDKAMTAARRALELDPIQAEAYAVLASRYSKEGRWSEAVRHIQKATELDPQNATAHHWAYIIYISAGRVGDAHREIEEAYRLDPLNAAIAGSLAWSHSVAGDYETAITMLETAEELGWGDFALPYIAFNHALKGDTKRAAELYAGFGATRDFVHFDWAPLFLKALQDQRHANEFAETMLRMVDAGEASPANTYYMLALVGSEMFQTVLERSPGDNNYIWALWYRDATAIRQTPAFRELVTELKLVEYWRQSNQWPDMCRPVGGDGFKCD